jgi:hypothetical protein
MVPCIYSRSSGKTIRSILTNFLRRRRSCYLASGRIEKKPSLPSRASFPSGRRSPRARGSSPSSGGVCSKMPHGPSDLCQIISIWNQMEFNNKLFRRPRAPPRPAFSLDLCGGRHSPVHSVAPPIWRVASGGATTRPGFRPPTWLSSRQITAAVDLSLAQKRIASRDFRLSLTNRE